MPPTLTFDHTSLIVPDLEDAIAFVKSALGFHLSSVQGQMYKLVLPTCLLCSCSNNSSSTTQRSGTDPVYPTVLVLDGGTVRINDLTYFTQDSAYDGRPGITLADPSFVIRHPRGTLLWDTGLSDSFMDRGAITMDTSVVTPSVDRPFAARLTEAGLTTDSIDFISLSHTHFDHIGNVGPFADVPWIVQKEELGWAFNKPDTAERTLIAPLQDSETITFTDTYDVFGDSSVVIHYFPGHTPGHAALLLRLASGPLLLSGDVYHFREQREFRRVPKFNTDVEQSLATMTAFEELARRTGARVIIQHDSADFAALPVYPDYLD